MYVRVATCIVRQRARANLVVKSNSRETHFRVVLVYKLLATMSLLELGPVIFGGTEAIISYFRVQTSCHKLRLPRFAQFRNINNDM